MSTTNAYYKDLNFKPYWESGCYVLHVIAKKKFLRVLDQHHYTLHDYMNSSFIYFLVLHLFFLTFCFHPLPQTLPHKFSLFLFLFFTQFLVTFFTPHPLLFIHLLHVVSLSNSPLQPWRTASVNPSTSPGDPLIPFLSQGIAFHCKTGSVLAQPPSTT